MKTITILRKWGNPEIFIELTDQGISIELTLAQFIRALADEVAEPLVETIANDAGNPSLWFTKEALRKNLVQAIEGEKAHQHFVDAASHIISAVKQETVKVM